MARILGYVARDSWGHEPGQIVISRAVLDRLALSQKNVNRLPKVVDKKVGEGMEETKKFLFWVGRTQQVETNEESDVFYALVNRGQRPIWGRFVRGKKGRMTRELTTILHPVRGRGMVQWEVVAAYAGPPTPPFPGDPFTTHASREFWSTHALEVGALPYHPGTETTTCPW